MRARLLLPALVALLALLSASCAAPRSRAYATRADAEAAGETGSGALPAWVPASATALRLAGSADGERWLRFDLPPGDAAALKARLLRVPDAQVATLDLFAPRGADWWFAALAAARPDEPGAVVAEVYSGSGAEVSTRTWLAFDTRSDSVWVWSRGR